MWPSVGFTAPVVCWGGNTLPPMRFTTRVTSRPVTWLGVGWVICTRTGESGCTLREDDEEDPPQPVSVTAKASTAGSARRVILAVIVDTFLHGRNSRTATRPETPMVLAASAFEQWPT